VRLVGKRPHLHVALAPAGRERIRRLAVPRVLLGALVAAAAASLAASGCAVCWCLAPLLRRAKLRTRPVDSRVGEKAAGLQRRHRAVNRRRGDSIS
jgi:hypothetical protein